MKNKKITLTKEAQGEYQYLKVKLDAIVRMIYLRGTIDALEGIKIDLEKK